MGTLVRLDDRRPALTPGPEPRDLGDGDLLVIAAILWIASIARVTAAFLQHENFGAEATLAFLCVLFLPWLWLQGRGPCNRGGRAPTDQQPEQP